MDTVTNSSVFIVAPGAREPEPRISVFMQSQVESLREEGWRTFLGVIDDRSTPAGVLRNAVRLRRELRASRATVVHALYGSVTALVAAAICGARPLVVSFCGDDLLGTPVGGWRWRARETAARAIGLFAALFAVAIVVKSGNLLRALPRMLRGRAIVIPNGVNIERFRPRDRGECRRRLNWPPHETVIVFSPSVGDNAPVKNAPLARKAMEILCRTTPARLHMLSGMEPDDVALALNAADCLLVTSLHEGSPNIVKEAIACGLPVVSTPCGDVPERLRNISPGGVCGYDAAALATAMAGALAAGRRSNGPEELVRQGLGLRDVARQIVDIYASTLPDRAVESRNTAVDKAAFEKAR